jgi:colicin import membrane protein
VGFEQYFPSEFRKGVDDPKVIAVTMAKPGVILRGPVGSNSPFKEHAHLSAGLSRDEVKGRPEKPPSKLKKQPSCKIGDKAARNGALAFERESRGSVSPHRSHSSRKAIRCSSAVRGAT